MACALSTRFALLFAALLQGAFAEGPSREGIPKLVRALIKVTEPLVMAVNESDFDPCFADEGLDVAYDESGEKMSGLQAKTLFVDDTMKAVEKMMEKRKKSMRLGLRGIAAASLFIAQYVEHICKVETPILQKASMQLMDFAQTKVNIEYEKMKGLKVGGIDAHMRLNNLIGKWKATDNEEMGKALGEFLALFIPAFPKIPRDEEESGWPHDEM